jgi:hypothetical protein
VQDSDSANSACVASTNGSVVAVAAAAAELVRYDDDDDDFEATSGTFREMNEPRSISSSARRVSVYRRYPDAGPRRRDSVEYEQSVSFSMQNEQG